MIQRYRELKQALLDGNFDACGLRAGKFAEVVLRFLQFRVTGTFTPFGTKLGTFTDECAKLVRMPRTSGSESLRITIPRALDFVYTLRNKRDIGHEGGDVEANEIDAAACARVADWCMAELIRECHGLSLEEAQVLVDNIAERQTPEVWEVLGKRRVLDPNLTAKDSTLLLLYSDSEPAVLASDLAEWVECRRLSEFRRDVLRPLHRSRLIEYAEGDELVVLLPPGIARVETEILPKLRGTPRRDTR